MVGFSYITWVFVYSETDMLCIHTREMEKKKYFKSRKFNTEHENTTWTIQILCQQQYIRNQTRTHTT